MTDIGLQGGAPVWNMSTDTYGQIDDVIVQNSPSGDSDVACNLTVAATPMRHVVCSNHSTNLVMTNAGARGSNSAVETLYDFLVDECTQSAGGACAQFVNSNVNIVGGTWYNGGSGVPSISADTTSALYITQANIGTFSSGGGNSCGITLVGNARLYLSDTDIAGNGTSAAICGPSSSTFVSVGGNQIFNQVAGTRTLCTAATQTTAACGWSGGVIPKSTETHTPNTCYAANGIVSATQNLCTILLDQNYQVLNITAQSGGNAPGNSSCSVAPVITVSDGTRSATLTLTTGKTGWSSAVDSATVNTVFASGATLTISIGTFTCTTPPVNLSVNTDLQSVLNP